MRLTLTMDDYARLPSMEREAVDDWTRGEGRTDLRGVEIVDEGGRHLVVLALVGFAGTEIIEAWEEMEASRPFPICAFRPRERWYPAHP